MITYMRGFLFEALYPRENGTTYFHSSMTKFSSGSYNCQICPDFHYYFYFRMLHLCPRLCNKLVTDSVFCAFESRLYLFSDRYAH